MRILRKELNFVVQVVETILQFRLDRSKSLLQHLSSIRNQIRKSYKFETFDQTILTSLVPQETYKVRSKLSSLGFGKFTEPNEKLSIRLRFKAIQKCTSQVVNEENWLFQVEGNTKNCFSDKKMSNWALLDLVDYIIRHLLYFELTPQTKDRKKSHNKYLVDYILQIGPPKDSQQPLPFIKNLWQKRVYSKGQNVNEGFKIQACCFYKDHEMGNYLKEQSTSTSSKSSNGKHKNSDGQVTVCTRRVSLFEMYDEDLEMVVLSGNDSMMSEKKAEEICLQVDEEDEFQILMEQTRTEDQIFLEENNELMKEISSLQDAYFQYQ